MNIPIDTGKAKKTVLRQKLQDMGLVYVVFKRKLEFNGNYLTQNVDSEEVLRAMEFLVQTPLYQELGIRL